MAIHEQNYVRYEGNLHERRAFWVIARTTVMTYFAFWRTRLMLLFLWLAPLIGIVVVFFEFGLRSRFGEMADASPPTAGPMLLYLQIQMYSLVLLFIANGCGVISEDLRYRTFQLYFSKSLGQIDYALGKFLGLFMYASLVTIIPWIILASLRSVLFIQTEFAGDVAMYGVKGLLFSVIGTVVMTSLVMGLSSLTPRTGYVVLSWIGVILVPLILSGIVLLATGGEPFARLFSITGQIGVASEWLLMPDTEFDGPRWLAPLSLAALTAAGLGLTWRRISRLEGIA